MDPAKNGHVSVAHKRDASVVINAHNVKIIDDHGELGSGDFILSITSKHNIKIK